MVSKLISKLRTLRLENKISRLNPHAYRSMEGEHSNSVLRVIPLLFLILFTCNSFKGILSETVEKLISQNSILVREEPFIIAACRTSTNHFTYHNKLSALKLGVGGDAKPMDGGDEDDE